jgi:hypothetical protein
VPNHSESGATAQSPEPGASHRYESRAGGSVVIGGRFPLIG